MNNLKAERTLTADLLPCPFCGSKPYAYVQNSSSMLPGATSRYMQLVWCDDCGTQGPLRETEEQAIAAWNSRSQSLSTQQPMGEPVAMIVRIDGEDEIMWLEGSLEVGPGNYLYALHPNQESGE